jgi:hypothetical protein
LAPLGEFAGITQVGTSTLNLKQEKLTDRYEDSPPTAEVKPSSRKRGYKSGKIVDINVADFKGHPLWDILQETVQSRPTYANLAGYARKNVISDNPTISARELASRLSITVGEALVILHGIEDEVQK